MPLYSYRARKGPNEIVEDTIEALHREDAVEKISRMGYLPIKVEEKAAGARPAPSSQSLSFFRGRVSSRDITIFTRQLSTLIRSGVPILTALNILAEQSGSPGLQRMLSRVSQDVKEGLSFSRSLESWPKVFSPFYVAMVRAGEDSGGLQETLLRIASYRQKQEDLVSRVRAAMAYPILMALVGIGTVVFMFVFVLPKLSTLFVTMGQQLPWPTRVVIGISTFLRQKWPWLFLGIGSLGFLVSRTSTFKAHQKFMSLLALRVPVVSRFFLNNEFARFCRTLEVLIVSGIPILRAMSVSIPILSNVIIKAELERSRQELEQGAGFGKSLKRSKLFPPFLVSLISVGEESGKLGEALAEIARAYEQECDDTLRVMTSLLEPLMILSMGLVVGFIVVAMLLPIFEMNLMVR